MVSTKIFFSEARFGVTMFFFIFSLERETDLFFLADVAVSRVNNIQKYNEERKKW